MVRLVSPVQSNFRVLTYGFLDRVSAWYLGFVVTGLGMCISTLTMMCFPSSVPESTSKQFEVQKDSNKAKITDEPVTIRGITAHPYSRTDTLSLSSWSIHKPFYFH